MNQTEMILEHMQKNGSITQAESISLFGCYRLSARIYDLRARGLDVRKTTAHGVNRYGKPMQYARYYLNDAADQTA